jgi:hypothetical protein
LGEIAQQPPGDAQQTLKFGASIASWHDIPAQRHGP